MKLKALILAGMVCVAGGISSQAQTVFSVNAVGFVNKDVPTGFSLISNPLSIGGNTLAEVLPSVPDGTTVFTFNPITASFSQAQFNGTFGVWDNPSTVIAPGSGFFINNTSGSTVTLTFTGEVLQGTASNTSIVAGFSIISSAVPQSGQLDTALGFPAADGDLIFRFDPVSDSYSQATFNGTFGVWDNAANATIDVGEAVFVNKAAAANWDRNFSVNAN